MIVATHGLQGDVESFFVFVVDDEYGSGGIEDLVSDVSSIDLQSSTKYIGDA